MRNVIQTLPTRAALAAALLMPVSAFAVAIPVANHSFEMPDVLADEDPNPWVDSANDPTLDDGTYDWTSNFGENFALFMFYEEIAAVNFTGGDAIQYGGLRGDLGYIYQDLGVPFEANKTYTVDLDTAHRSGFNHAMAEWGLFSSDDLGTDIGTPGFADIQGVWTGSANPDADDMFDVLRSGTELAAIGSGALGQPYTFTTGDVVPSGNVVVFIRADNTGDRIQFDNITVDVSDPGAGVVGDTDGDGDIDDFDLLNAISNFTGSLAPGTGGKGVPEGDTDTDADVDDFDLLTMISGFTGSLSAPAVPEPGSVALLSLGTLALLRRRRA